MSLVTEIDEASLTQRLSDTPGFVLLDLWAPWCVPCRTLAPVLKRLAATFESGLQVAKLDVERYPDAMTRFAVRGIPTLLLFKDGAEVDRSVGAKSQAQLSEWLLGAGVPEGSAAAAPADAAPSYSAFYGDASLQAFLWQRLADRARRGGLVGGVQPLWSAEKATVSAALVQSAEADIFERITGLSAAFASTLDAVNPLSAQALDAIGQALQPGSDLRLIPLRLLQAFLGEPAFDWPGLLRHAPELDLLRQGWLADGAAPGRGVTPEQWSARVTPFFTHDDLAVQLTAVLLAALVPLPALDEAPAWDEIWVRAARLSYAIARHVAGWSLAEQNMELSRHHWFIEQERQLPGGAFCEQTLEAARARWLQENADYERKDEAFYQAREWEWIETLLRQRLVALLHAAPRHPASL